MTDQNVAYRNDADNSVDEDPLAELARIVAGEPEPAKPAPARVESVAVEPEAPFAANAQHEPEAEFDIEAELMRELGEAEPSYVTGEQEPVEETFAPAMPPRSLATPVPSSSYAEEEMSLEDQLMAELSNDDDALADSVPPQAHVISRIDTETVAPVADPEPQNPVVSNEASAPQADDELDDFFSEGFSDLLEEEVAAQSAPVKPKSLATPQINEPAPAEVQMDDDLESQFGDAFAAELEAVEPQHSEIQIQPDLEDEFAKAFEEQMLVEPPKADQSISTDAIGAVGAVAAASAAVRSSANIDDNYLDDPAFDDIDDRNYAAAPISPQPSRNGFKLAVGALCAALVVGVGVVGWGAMNGSGSTGDQPQIIKADSEPVKVKPDEPGGKKIENQDNQVYTKVAGSQVDEKVQEELITTRAQVSEDAKATNRLAPKVEADQQQTTLGISPKRVRTLTVKPDGTIVQSDPEPAPAAETATVAEVATEAAPLAVEESVLASIDGATSTGNLAIPTPSPLPAPVQNVAAVSEVPAPKPAAPKPAVQAEVAPSAASTDPNAPTQIANLNNAPAPAPTVTSSEWKVQVSSQRSREAAEASFNNIQNRFSSVLSGRSASIERADVDGKGTFYRVKILAESKSEAGNICSRLKSAGGSCFVTR